MDCPACGTTRIDRQVLQRHNRYRLYQCGRCGVQFWWPTKHPGAAWYAECDIYGGRLFGANRSRTYWNHRQFLMEPPAGGELLDVACGEGAFLAAAQRAGYRVNGIDFDADAVRIARESMGLERVWPVSVDDFLAGTQRRFDVITFFELLEHLDNPRKFLLSIKRLLRPGGHIALSVPNRRRWSRIVNLAEIDLPPHHLTRWDAEGLTAFLDLVGFDVVTIRQQQMDTEGMVSVLHYMMPYRILWQRGGKLLAKHGRASRGETAHLAEKAFIRGMRVLRAAHRLALVPAAAMTAWILRRRGQLGLGLYACAKLRNDPQ